MCRYKPIWSFHYASKWRVLRRDKFEFNSNMYTRKNAQFVTSLQQTCSKLGELNSRVTSCFNNLPSSCKSTTCQQVVSNKLGTTWITALLQLVDKLVTSLLRAQLVDKMWDFYVCVAETGRIRIFIWSIQLFNHYLCFVYSHNRTVIKQFLY